MKLISIIIPVYNAENSIRKTVQSILDQECKSYEIILVDDGSTDQSLQICRDYEENYDQVICVHSENRGPGHARNLGIAYANGEWIAFCDSDDVVDKTIYRKLLSKAQETNSDLCVCDFFSERDQSNMGLPWDKAFFEGKAVINEYMASMVGNISDNIKESPFWGSSCRSIYKRDILMRHFIRFPEDISFAEDLVFNLRYTIHCNSVAVVPEVLYFYSFNEKSIMNSYNCRYVEDMFEKRLNLVNYISEVLQEAQADKSLWDRLLTTERCYYSECIGNACTKTAGRTRKKMLDEVKYILNHERTIRAFSSFDAKSPRKRLLYFAIKKRLVHVFYYYYRIRLYGLVKV